MYKLYTFFLILASISIVMGCGALMGEEIGRLPINAVSTDDNNLILTETSMDLKKDDKIGIWSEMDMEYNDEVALRFRIEILKDGEQYGGLEIDPMDKNITIGEVKTDIMGKTKWRFSGKNTRITVEEDGNYTFKGILVASENPSLIIKKAEVVFRQ